MGEVESSGQLLDRARHGDLGAREALWTRYLPRLRRWAKGRLPAWARDLLDTDDLVQKTVLDTFDRLDDFRPAHEGALQAYLRQALLNRVRDALRSARRRVPPGPLSEDAVDAAPSPLEEAVGRDLLERYEAALGRLRPDDRAAIVARLEMGGTWEELAQVLCKPSPDAARVAVSRALLRLAEEMGRAG